MREQRADDDDGAGAGEAERQRDQWPFAEAGNHQAMFNSEAAKLEPGTYFVKLNINGQTSTQKIIKIRD